MNFILHLPDVFENPNLVFILQYDSGTTTGSIEKAHVTLLSDISCKEQLPVSEKPHFLTFHSQHISITDPDLQNEPDTQTLLLKLN